MWHLVQAWSRILDIFENKKPRELSLFLIRGIPTCGKTSLARLLADGRFPVLEADDYFMVDGKYRFDRNKLHAAHRECQLRTSRLMIRRTSRIFVSNTFTKGSEIKPYYDLAAANNYRVYCVVVEKRHSGTNDHNVPPETLERMENSMRNNIRLR